MSVADEAVRRVVPLCWCCGGEFGESELVRLGMHPEVGVCLQCARFLQRRAAEREDVLHPSAAARVRAAVHGVREQVIRRGWHERLIIGWLLRRIDRRLP
jgi:hypothetical protein